MIKIDSALLQDIGLGDLPPQEKDGLLKHIYETLEMRVGMRLADQMSNQQLDEFEQYFEAKDDAGAFKWLEANFPNYKDIVQEEFDKLKAEVEQSAPQILAASQSAAPAPAAAQPSVGPAGPYQPQPMAGRSPDPYQSPTPLPPGGPYQPQQPQQQPPADPYAAPYPPPPAGSQGS